MSGYVNQAGEPITFEEYAQNLAAKYVEPSAPGTLQATADLYAGLNEKGMDFNALTAAFNQFNAKLDKSTPPQTWDDFINQWRASSGVAVSAPTGGAPFAKFFTDFLNIITPTWSPQFTPPQPNAAMFNKTFAAFLENYPPVKPSDGPAPFGSITTFVSNWHKFMTTTAVILNSPTLSGQPFAGLTSYEAIYKAFFPGKTQFEFFMDITKFVTDTINKTGVFLPSRTVSTWFDHVRTLYANNTGVDAKVLQAQQAGTNKSVILITLFNLLVKMIETLQKVAATQAERLTFLAKYQQAYTTLMTQLPVFTQGDANKPWSSVLSGSSDAAKEARMQLNTKNSALMENARSYRSQLADETKQRQTEVNQSNEAVNQQASMATSLIQQMSTILQSIFR